MDVHGGGACDAVAPMQTLGGYIQILCRGGVSPCWPSCTLGRGSVQHELS